MPRLFAAAVLLSSAALAAAADPAPAAKPRVKLAVLVVFDQLRGDYIDKWRPLFGPDGFARLQSDGAWFARCYYPYATTTTGPGHASMLTGTCPDKHGIVNNNWYDTAAAADTYCAGSSRYQFVPAPKPAAEPAAGEKGADAKPKPKAVGNPDNLLSETVGDVLKRTTPGGKVFGLSLKDRSAIFPTGKRPDGAYWFVDGRFVTSTYYADRAHPWVESFNASGAADRWFGKDWTRFRPDVDYDRHAGPDQGTGEGKGVGQGTTFPHPLTGGKPTLGKSYYDALANSPFGNELLLEFAKACVTAEKLGQDDVPDLLTVSFSSNDLVGHTWGPDSHEVLDVTLRADRVVAGLLSFLDGAVGKGNYAVALTADHGVCPLPDFARSRGQDGQRVQTAGLLFGAEKHLRDAFGNPGEGATGKAALWVETVAPPWLYLNPRFVAKSGKTRAEVAAALADHVAKYPGVARTFTRDQLAGDVPEGDAVGRLAKRAYFPDRCGDVYVVLNPYHLWGKPLDSGTTHGSPHDYDRHVPLLVYGPGVVGGRKDEPTAPQAAAATLARFLGVPPPKDADFPVPATLEK